MKLSFKYRFIISFVLLEILFLAMIASVNFSSLEQNSQRLINERINALKSLGNELVVTPLSVYDLATLDNILSGLSELEGVEKISLFDAQGKKLSEVGDTNQLNGSIIKIDKEITFESMKLGMLHFWLDLSQNYAEINSNRSLTLKIIFLEIILSIIISYIIGFRLSRDLEKLTEYVRLIGEKGTANVPTLNGKDEVTELANAMNIMQTKINDRNERLNIVNNALNNSVKVLKEYENAVSRGSILSRGDLNGNIIDVNNAFCEITGYTKEELIGKPHNILRHPNTPKSIFREMWKSLQDGEVWHGIFKNVKKDGSVFYADSTMVPIFENGKVIEYLALRKDVTELVNKKVKLRKTFQTDMLTSLGNRFSLYDKIKQINKPFLAVFDIQGFRKINDVYGFEIGDELIRQIAEYLFDFFKVRHYSLYRFHADEFAVLADGLSVTQNDFISNLQNFQSDIEEKKFIVHNHQINVFITIGVTFSQKQDIINHSSVVHHSAKEKNVPFLVYTDSLKTSEEYQKNIQWTAKLVDALQSNRILAFYQPIVNNLTKEIVKYETLIRLEDTDGTIVSPIHFLDVSKSIRIYPQLTKKMIDACFSNIIKLNKSISVNLSGDDLSNEETMTYIYTKLREFELGHKITFEIVESEGIYSLDAMEHFIKTVKKHGCKIAIDDFGTGYSNFDYLIKLKADFIKIDGSMIKNINKDDNTYNVVKSIVEFAKINSMKTIAEFVSDESIYKTVSDLGIDYSQGYFFGKPEPMKEIKV